MSVNVCMRLFLYGNCFKSIRKYSKLSYVHNVGTEPLRPLTLGQLLEQTCADYGPTTAVISCHQNKEMTFSELLDEADRLAAGFKRLGYQKGDKIALWAPNLAEWYVTFMACARGGYILVPLNPYYQKKELEYSINKVGINAIVAPEKFRNQKFYEIITSLIPDLTESHPGKLRNQTVPSLKSVIMMEENQIGGTYSYNDILNFSDEDSVAFIKGHQKSIKIDDPCYIMFTSGTTGQSKAPVISHFSAVNNGYYIGKRNQFGEKQHTLCIQNPLFHAFGALIGLVSAVSYATTVVLPAAKYDAERHLEVIKKHKCTIIYGTPTMYVDLVNLQKEKNEKLYLESAVTGGAICSPHLFNNMKELLGLKKVKSIYGLTETTGSNYHSLRDDDEVKCTTTVGYLQEHLEAKVIDLEGNIVPRGVPGELCIRGYTVMLNYYGDEEKTNDSKDVSGWFHTGDLFIIDEDGYGEVVGRIKDMIIRGGENIYPREIENFLNTHPDILEAQVIGLPHKRLGEEVCACIRTKDNKQLTKEDIQEFCLGNIANFKIPTVVEIVAEFPKTVSGKVQKIELVKMFKNK